MRFRKVSEALPRYLDRFDFSKLKDPFRTSLISVIYTDCRTSKPEVAVAYFNRPEDSIKPIFPYQADRFTAGRATEAIFVSPYEMLIITILSSNPIDASLILRNVVDFIGRLE